MSEWVECCVEDGDSGSDHKMVWARCKAIRGDNVRIYNQVKWNTRKANWFEYEELMISKLVEWEIWSREASDINEIYEAFVRSVVGVSEEVVGKVVV